MKLAQKNTVHNIDDERKQYENFHKVCSLYQNDILIEKSLSFEILGPCKIVYEPEKENCKVWIETDSEVIMINDVTGE